MVIVEWFSWVNPLAWWILVLVFSLLMFVPRLNQENWTKTHDIFKPAIGMLASKSQRYIDDENYLALAKELVGLWQWQKKMSLDISWQVSGLEIINQQLIKKFEPNQHDWVKPLLFHENIKLTKAQCTTLCNTIEKELIK